MNRSMITTIFRGLLLLLSTNLSVAEAQIVSTQFPTPDCGTLVEIASTPTVSLPRPLPHLKQDVNGKCGPTSLAIGLNYFGRIHQTNPYDPLQLPNQITDMVAAVAKSSAGLSPLTVLDPLSWSVAVNSANNLAATALLYGLSAKVETANLNQIASYVGQQEVVLIYWWQGPGPLDFHWSVVQGLGPVTVHLRDPWPSDPSDNFQQTLEFIYRSTTGTPGFFQIVRLSANPILF